MNTSFGYRVVSFLSSFSLLIQTFAPFFSVPALVRAQESLRSDISYSISNKDFKFGVNNKEAGITTGQIQYQLSYKNDSSDNPEQIELVQGTVDLSDANFEKTIDAATCSANGTCHVHEAPRGILKIKISGWTNIKWFSISGETVTVVNEKSDGVLDTITDEENNWLLKGVAPDPSATPVLPSPTAEPTVVPTDIPAVLPTAEPSVTVAPTGAVLGATGDEVVQAAIVQSGQAYVDPSIWTDKGDYAPTEKVVVTGKNFTPGYTYTIVISSNDPPAVNATGSVTASSEGTFTYEYQLDGNYRPSYLVQIMDEGGVVAKTNFTDANDWPNCNFNCTANDVSITSVQLVNSSNQPITSCNPGDQVDAYIRITYDNHSTTRYGLNILADVYAGGTKLDSTYPQGHCVTNTWPTGPYSDNIYHFTWTCGQPVEVKNVVISWGVNDDDTCSVLSCNSRKAHSYCGSSFSVNIPVVPNFTNTEVCQGNATAFNDSTTGGTTPYSYNWDFGDLSAHATTASPTHTYALAGSYSVTDSVTDSSVPVQTNSITKSVNVWANPTADFSFVPQSCPSTSIAFTNNTTGGSSYIWNFGDGTPTSIDVNPTHVYSQPGNYTVTLSTTSEHSCQNSTQKTVSILPCYGSLTVNKVTVPANDTTQFGISVSGPGVTDADRTTLATDHPETFAVTGGAYSVTETADDSWVEDVSSCQNVSVAAGESKSCTITNTKKGTIELIKVWSGSASQMTLNIGTSLGGNDVASQTTGAYGAPPLTTGAKSVAPGTYYLSETGDLNDYNSQLFCTDNNVSVDIGANDSITVAAGHAVVCTFTNTQKLGGLKVTKTVNWNGVVANGNQTFSICIQGPSYPVSADCKTIGSGGGDLIWTDLIPGGYTVTEPVISSEWDVQITNSPVSVPTNGGTATATVTNTRKHGGLNITKTVNWNGLPADQSKTFSICIQGPSYPVTADCKTIGYNGGVLSWSDLIPGDYTVSETDPGSVWNVAVSALPVTVPLDGGTATATVANTLQTGTIELKKIWSGSAGQTTLQIGTTESGSDIASVQTGTNGSDPLTTGAKTVKAGTYYVSEVGGLDNYNWTLSCTDNGYDISPASNVLDVASGHAVVCTFTNSQKLGSLRVTKVANWNGIVMNTNQTFGICIQGPSYPIADCKDAGYTGGDLTWTGLIPGDYYVTEPYIGYEWTASVPDAPVTVPVNGGAATATVTNNRKLGNLTVTKTVDWGGVTPDQTKKFSICIQGSTYPTGNCKDIGYTGGVLTWTGLIPDYYTVTETDPGSGWTVNINSSPVFVPVNGGTATVTVANTTQQAKLTVIKHVANTHGGSLNASDFTMRVSGTNVSSTSFAGDENGTSVMLDAGSYSVDEAKDFGYSKTLGESCSGTIANGETKTCTITNEDKQGILIITKHVINDDGGTKTAKDFTIQVNGGNVLPGSSFPGSEEGVRVTVNAGAYSVDEADMTGYTKAIGEGCSGTMGVGDIVYCTITNNDSPKPVLSLSKFNSTWPNDTTAGSNVQYTLTLKVGDNSAYGVVVTDLPPAGFKPVGNCDVYKNDVKVATFACADMYHSPGKWNLGDAAAGDVFKMVYSAAIDGSQKPGLYKDLAWAFGCADTSEGCSVSNGILATAESSGTADPGTFADVDTFVGTKVSINANEQDTPSVNVKKEERGEVLGASTSLPSTGTPNYLIIISGLFTMLGLFLFGIGLYKRKALRLAIWFSAVILACSLFLILTAGAEAATSLHVRLVQPKSPTRINDFTLGYVTLDLQGQPVTVKCYKKGPSDGSFSQIGGDLSVTAGGNNGQCPLTSSMISNNGTYQFYATAASGSGLATSETISVDYNTSGPGTPTSYGKDKISNCEYKIRFKTADDGQTAKVEIYRSDSTLFNADGGTRVSTMTIGPNQDGIYNDVVPDCNKTYYYVIRAFDSAGNGSGTIGDSITTTTTSTTGTSSSGTEAIPVANVTLAAGPQEGSVLGANEEAGGSSQSAEKAGSEGAVLAAETKQQNGGPLMWIFGHKKISLGVLVLLSLLYFGIMRYVKKQKSTGGPPTLQ